MKRKTHQSKHTINLIHVAVNVVIATTIPDLKPSLYKTSWYIRFNLDSKKAKIE